MAKLSEIAWQKTSKIIKKIQSHPFNLELASGDLAMDKFAYYIEQDSYYLKYFSRSLAMIASRSPFDFIKDFLSFSEGALVAEQEVVHVFFRKTFNFKDTGKLTPAALCYTNYLLKTSSIDPIETAIAAVLPCFWVYQKVGTSIANTTDTKSRNPYLRWIENYSGEEFENSVKKAIAIFDEIALSVSDKIRLSMLDAFYKSTVLEWHFWNDAYHKKVFDHLIE